MTDAIIYCRRSNRNNNSYYNKMELSIVHQNKVCSEYATKHNMLVINSITENSSARNINNQKGLLKLLENLKDNTLILVSDVSRFSRNMRQALEILESLRLKKIYVHAVCNNCTYNDQSHNRFHFRSYLNQAEFESDQISERLIRSISERKKVGIKIGSSKFGYECFYDKGIRRERINKKEKDVIELIMIKKTAGQTHVQIANFLNKKKYKYRDKKWTALYVRYVISKNKKIDVSSN